MVLFFVFPALSGLLGKLPFVWFLGIAASLFGKYLAYLPGIIFGDSLFELTEFGMEPEGIVGRIVVVIFYTLLALALSWPGNLWKEKTEEALPQ